LKCVTHGIDFVRQNSPTSSKYLIETTGGGVALFDDNIDGRLDMLLVNSGSLSPSMQPPANFRRSMPRYWNRLYRQEADGTFTDVTRAAGLVEAGDTNYGMGVTIGDYDNDGYEDIYITDYGKNSLLAQQSRWHLHRCNLKSRCSWLTRSSICRRVWPNIRTIRSCCPHWRELPPFFPAKQKTHCSRPTRNLARLTRRQRRTTRLCKRTLTPRPNTAKRSRFSPI
jgi:hypothetical protein